MTEKSKARRELEEIAQRRSAATLEAGAMKAAAEAADAAVDAALRRGEDPGEVERLEKIAIAKDAEYKLRLDGLQNLVRIEKEIRRRLKREDPADPGGMP